MKQLVLSRGIDTLIIGYSMEGKLDEGYETFFASAKEMCQQGHYSDFPVELYGTSFVILPYGSEGYEWLLKNDDIQMAIARSFTGGKIRPEIMVTLRSSFLWREGVEAACRKVNITVSKMGIIVEEKVSRVDPCVDIQMAIPQVPINDDQIQGRMKVRKNYIAQSHAVGMTLTGYQFGKGTIVARTYDKTREVLVSDKAWFHDIWRKGGWDETTPVTRVEFQCRREILKQFSINSVKSLFEVLPDLWHYLCNSWLVMRKRSSSDSRRTRWPLSDLWEQVQSTVFGSLTGILRFKQIAPRVSHLASMIQGIAISMTALYKSAGKSIEESTEDVRINIQSVFDIAGFNTLVNSREARFAIC